MELLPDLAALSDDELKHLIEELKREEAEISFKRRMLHGKIDILRAELVARIQQSVGGSGSTLGQLDVEKLTAILASKATPQAPGA